jgi:hypothetical protein
LGGLPVYSTPPTSTNIGVGVFGLFLYPGDFSCRDFAISLVAICVSEVLAGDFAISLLHYLARLLPQRTSVRSKSSSYDLAIV